jgi:hypothetical protein
LTSTDNGVRAERPVRDAGTDVDAACNAANTGGNEVAGSEANEEPVAVAARFARRRHQLGAQQRIDRGDDGKRQRATENFRHERSEIAAASEARKIGEGRQTYSRARPAGDDWAEVSAKTSEPAEIIEHTPKADADDDRRNLG